jgi:hypothetical protein
MFEIKQDQYCFNRSYCFLPDEVIIFLRKTKTMPKKCSLVGQKSPEN